jgi:arylsulfatase A-like enzyme
VSCCRIVTAFVVPLSLFLGTAILTRYGEWVFVGFTGHSLLLGFFLVAAILLSAAGGLGVAACLTLSDRVLRHLGVGVVSFLLAGFVVGWLQKMLRMVSISVSSSAYANPFYLAAMGSSLVLMATVARGQRSWRRLDVIVLVASCVGLGVAVAWLNLVYLRKADIDLGRILNLAFVVAAHAITWLGIRRSASRSTRVFSFGQTGRKGAVGYSIMILCCAIALAPLYLAAKAAGEPPSVSSARSPVIAPRADDTAAEESPARKNVILISIDTLRADHLGIYGHERTTSPNIDRFFGKGLVFERTYAQAPWTLPSHASMFTGQYPSTHGISTYPNDTFGYVDRLRPDLVTIAEILSEHGFETAGFTGGVYLTQEYGFDQGFEVFEVTRSTRMEEALDLALPWLEHERDRPFFLFLHSFDVHRYQPPHYFEDLSDNGYAGPLRDLLLEQPHLFEAAVITDGLSQPTTEDMSFVRNLYDTEIRVVDEQLQRLFSALEHSGLIENTAVILTSDHGENFWEQGDSGHCFTLQDPTLRVPLLISAPGLRQGRRIDGFARVIDIPVTILEIAGVSSRARDRMHGVELLTQIGGGGLGPDTVIAEADRFGTQACIISGRFKYTHYGMPSYNLLRGRFALLTLRGLFSRFNRTEELFDLQADPAAQNNMVTADPERAALLRQVLFSRISELRSARDHTEESDARLTPELREKLRALGYID